MSAIMVPTRLTATQRFCCSVCRREETTTQQGDSFTGPGAAQFAFAVKLPDGWHVFDGRPLCSLACALQALDRAWPEGRQERQGNVEPKVDCEAAPSAARS